MIQYSIYVTKEIAKKAFEKGAEIIRLQTMSIEQYNAGWGYKYAIDPMYFAVSPSIIIPEDKNALDLYYTPTAEQICNWLRVEKHLWVYPDYVYISEDNEERWFGKVINLDTKKIVAHGDNPQIEYIDALLDGINKALELI